MEIRLLCPFIKTLTNRYQYRHPHHLLAEKKQWRAPSPISDVRLLELGIQERSKADTFARGTWEVEQVSNWISLLIRFAAGEEANTRCRIMILLLIPPRRVPPQLAAATNGQPAFNHEPVLATCLLIWRSRITISDFIVRGISHGLQSSQA